MIEVSCDTVAFPDQDPAGFPVQVCGQTRQAVAELPIETTVMLFHVSPEFFPFQQVFFSPGDSGKHGRDHCDDLKIIEHIGFQFPSVSDQGNCILSEK